MKAVLFTVEVAKQQHGERVGAELQRASEKAQSAWQWLLDERRFISLLSMAVKSGLPLFFIPCIGPAPNTCRPEVKVHTRLIDYV